MFWTFTWLVPLIVLVLISHYLWQKPMKSREKNSYCHFHFPIPLSILHMMSFSKWIRFSSYTARRLNQDFDALFNCSMCLYWNYKALGNFYQIYISRFISMKSPAMCLTIIIHILCLRMDISWKLPYVGLKYIFHGNSEKACYTEDAENSKGIQNKLS